MKNREKYHSDVHGGVIICEIHIWLNFSTGADGQLGCLYLQNDAIEISVHAAGAAARHPAASSS